MAACIPGYACALASATERASSAAACGPDFSMELSCTVASVRPALQCACWAATGTGGPVTRTALAQLSLSAAPAHSSASSLGVEYCQ